MSLGAEFVLKMNNNQALAALNAVQDGFKGLTDTVKGDLTQKLKSIFTVAVIEEATRRTGEWAQKLERTAISAGTTTEKIQAMNYAAAELNLDPSKVTGFFDDLDTKRREALSGNQELINSFMALGYSMDDLKSGTKSQLFDKLISQDRGYTAGSVMGSHLENLTGVGSLQAVQALHNQMGGSLSGYSDNLKSQGMTVDNQSVSDMSATWTQIKIDLSQSLTALSPIGSLLLKLASILSESLLGAMTTIADIFNIVWGIVTLDGDKITRAVTSLGSVVMNMIFGITKMFTTITDAIARGIEKLSFGFLGKTTGLTPLVQDQQNKFNKENGANRNEIRGGEGLGDLATIAATGGVGGTARVGSKILLDAAGVAEKAGAKGLADSLLGGATKLDKYGNSSGLAGNAAKSVTEKINDFKSTRQIREYVDDLLHNPNHIQRDISKEVYASRIGSVSGVAGNIGTIAGTALATTNVNKGKPSEELPYNGFVRNIPATSYSGESLSMLKMGGTFGAGMQSRIIRLNEDMVKLLSSINQTLTYDSRNNRPDDSNPAPRVAGGI